MRFRQFVGCAATHCRDRAWSTPIAVTTLSGIDARCAIAVSSRLSPSAAPNMAAALENIAGSLNARMPGCITSVVSAFVSSAVQTFTARSSNSVAA